MGMFKNKYSEVRSGWKIALTYIMMLGISLIPMIISSVVFMVPEMAKNENNIEAATLAMSNNQIYFATTMILQNISLIAASIIIWKIFEKKKIGEMGISNIKKGYKEFGVGLALGAVTITIVAIVLLLIGSVKLVNPITSPKFTNDLIIGIFIFIAVGFGEEIFGRGLCMSVLKQTRNKWVVLIVSSIIFAAMHLGNDGIGMLPLINLFLVGMVFGYMFMKSSNIWMPIGFHITWNYFQGYIWGFQVSGIEINGIYKIEGVKNTLLNGGAFGPEGGLIVTLILILTFVFVYVYYRDKNIDTFINNNIEI